MNKTEVQLLKIAFGVAFAAYFFVLELGGP
jgi:hypothetical protein